MSIINTFTNEEFRVETTIYNDGVVGVRTIHLNKGNSYIEQLIHPSGNIIVNTWCEKTGDNSTSMKTRLPRNKKVITDPKPKYSTRGRPPGTTATQKERTRLLKQITQIKKTNNTNFPKKDEYQNKTNDELVLFIYNLKESFIEPIDKVMNQIRDFKIQHKLRSPYKKNYCQLNIDDLTVLYKRLVSDTLY